MNALRSRHETARIVSEVRQLEERLARARDRATIAKLIDRIDTLTAEGLQAERDAARLRRSSEASKALQANRGFRPRLPARRTRCLRLVKR